MVNEEADGPEPDWFGAIIHGWGTVKFLAS